MDLWVVHKAPVGSIRTLDVANLDLQPDESLEALAKLSEVFNDSLVERHLHIIVQVPSPANLPSEPEFDLNCSVLGGDGRLFSVKMPKSGSVDGLKDAIKKKMEPEFDHVAPCRMDLWKISDLNLPDDLNLKDKISDLKLDDKQPLSPMAKLSTVFSDKPEDQYVHIVVRVPPAGEFFFFFFQR
jgi:hypothetical protein